MTPEETVNMARGYILGAERITDEVERVATHESTGRLISIARNATENAISLSKALIASQERVAELERTRDAIQADSNRALEKHRERFSRVQDYIADLEGQGFFVIPMALREALK